MGVKYPLVVVDEMYLIVMKLLSVREGRETDSADLRSFASIADVEEGARAEKSAHLVISRGFSRGRDVIADVENLRTT